MEMAKLKVESAALAVEAVKARHRDRLMHEQPPLPLTKGSRRTAKNQSNPDV